MRTDTPKTIYLKDYKPYPYVLKHVDMNFDIHEGYTIVKTVLTMHAPDHCRDDLFLNGEHLELMEFKLDGEVTTDFQKDDKGLTLPCPHKKDFTLEITTRILPEKNTRLEGLYRSGDTYCTQCEAEGFRTITYFPDRPDVMSVFTVRVEANKEHYPVLLSNGNRLDHGDVAHGRHFSVWHDPWPKPCYLFALVAGNLAHIEDEFITKSGRKVELYIYVRPGDEGQCDHAMKALKDSMKWDEDVYGLEYDLDLFNIVAVSDFNMGAMENKSLNIFNTALVLAHQETATDTDFGRVESVIAHEYFHNWSGNRVTCRDWFQLSLKEGLTVFRDQEFSADMNSRGVQRIDDVMSLRRMQFPEDAGPLAHPIRPDNYIEINNFYTMTVYEKGAEVIRMIRTIVGAENYRRGTDLYFSRHDGQAATCEDWIKCHEDASGVDLSQFRLWYSQAGTPTLTFKGEYDDAAKTYTVTLSQSTPSTPGQPDKKPMHMPIALALLGADGSAIKEEIIQLKEVEQVIVYDDIAERPVPSVLRGFSAPVKLVSDLSNADLTFLMLHEADGFNKWEAIQQLYTRMINHGYEKAIAGEEYGVCPKFMQSIGKLLDQCLQPGADAALMARMLAPPSVGILEQGVSEAQPPVFDEVRQALIVAVKRAHKDALVQIYEAMAESGEFSVSAEAMGKRALRNAVLAILTSSRGSGCADRAKAHYDGANNMTDRVAALAQLSDMDSPYRDECFAHFYDMFKGYQLVVDKWFSLQATSSRPDLIKHLKKLREHPEFNIKNPNRARSLFGAFAMNNPAKFHAADGSGYEFLADAVIELNAINPQIAARMLTPMRGWKNYSLDRQEKMKACLERILKTPDLAPDVFEIASKSAKA